MTGRVVPDDAAGRAVAVDILRGGGIVALPTDTVYGIAVSLATPGGIERLYRVKGRAPDKAVMLLLDDAVQAARAGQITPAAAALAADCWPGGLTVIVPQRPDVPWPPALTGGNDTRPGATPPIAVASGTASARNGAIACSAAVGSPAYAIMRRRCA